MPKVNGIGFGDSTKIKISHFSKIIAMHLAITQAVLKRNLKFYSQSYRYVELTAGKGYTPDGLIGSTIAFLEQVEHNNFTIPYRADFIECEKCNIEVLKDTLDQKRAENGWKSENWHFHNGRYEVEIPELFSSKTNEFGLIFVDHSGGMPDFNSLQFIAKNRPKMEILLYLSTTNVKRLKQYTDNHLIDHINSIGKKYWLIRKAKDWDQFKWTFLLGSNAPDLFKDYSNYSGHVKSH